MAVQISTAKSAVYSLVTSSSLSDRLLTCSQAHRWHGPVQISRSRS
jgi:hypothetical protein